VTSQTVAHKWVKQEYDRLEVIYRAHPQAGTMFTSAPPARDGIVQAAAESATELPQIQWSKAELRIECPHPDGRPDVARVSLYFCPVECGQECERRTWGEQAEDRADLRQTRRENLKERWFYKLNSDSPRADAYAVMDLPKVELDSIISDLESHGFFTPDNRPATGGAESQLEVRLNRRWTSKRWAYEPSLDALTTRVYEHSLPQSAATGHLSPVEPLIRCGHSR
jgi:hypothetical protein